MVYISYNLANFKRVYDLAKRFPYIEIRQDLCNFNFNELSELLQVIKYPILTMKGDYKFAESVFQLGIKYKAFLIDFDANFGKNKYDELINLNLSIPLQDQFIVSQHIDYNEFIKFSSFKLFNELLKWNSRFAKFVIENVDTEEAYSRVKSILNLNNEKFAIFFTGKYGKDSRIEAYKNNCPLNYAAYQDIRINNSQLDIDEYERIV